VQGSTLSTDQRTKFLAHLAESCNVTASARAAGCERTVFYLLRAKDPDFKEAWEDALETATDALEAEARRRALHGVSRPLVSAGKVVKDDDGNAIVLHEYSDTLMMAQLKAYRRDRYGDQSKVEHSGNITVATGVPRG
jgi:hypothetical protein